MNLRSNLSNDVRSHLEVKWWSKVKSQRWTLIKVMFWYLKLHFGGSQALPFLSWLAPYYAQYDRAWKVQHRPNSQTIGGSAASSPDRPLLPQRYPWCFQLEGHIRVISIMFIIEILVWPSPLYKKNKNKNKK